MADLETLTLEVETTVGESESALQSVTKNLKGMKAALDSIDTKSLSSLTNSLKNVSKSINGTGIKKAADDIKKQVSAISNLKKAADFSKGFASGSWKTAKTTVTGLATAMKGLNNAFILSKITSGKFISSLARIAGYRFVRAIISGITKSASTGLENLAHASSEANATLSQLSSGVLTLQNSIGGALYSVLASIIGVLNSIISAAVSAINWISMLFAILGGRATFKKATSSTKEYASALGGAAGGAKALKQELMGFDEINSLSPDSGGGGGGGGGMLDYGSMFEEVPVSESLKDMVDKADFTVLGEKLANKVNTALGNIDWTKIQTGAYKLANSLVTFINGFIGEVNANIIGDTIAGLINTGITFVNRLGYGIGWRLLGTKIKVAIMRAIVQISPASVGLAFTAKINAVVETLKGAIPTTGEEWSVITNWIAESINASINAIDAGSIGEIAGRLVTGALRMITSIGETGVLTNIANAISTAIKHAVENISEEDIKAAAKAVIEDAWKAVKVVMNLLVDIGDTIPGKMLTSFALYKAIAPGMKAAGLTGYSATGRALALAGSITLALDAVANLNSLIEGANNGVSVKTSDVMAIVGSGLESAGLALLSGGRPAEGLFALGIGIIAKAFLDDVKQLETGANKMDAIGNIIGKSLFGALFGVTALAAGVSGGLFVFSVAIGIKISDVLVNTDAVSETYTEGMFDGALEPAIQAASSIEELKGVFEQYSGVSIDMSQFEQALQVLGGADTANASMESLKTALTNLFAAFGYLGQEGQTISDFFTTVLANAGILTTGATEVQGAASTIAEATATMNEATSTVTDASAAVEGATSGITGLATELGTVTSAMQATGEQAETLKTNVVEIPSDIVFNLTLNNYDSVLAQLAELKKQMASVASLNWFGMGHSAMNAFKRGLKSVKLPTIKVSWSTSSKSASIFGKKYTISIPSPSIKMYKRGGFPTAGELFMANEDGMQEMVGRIGNRPAVANQDQIGDAIFKYMDAHQQESGGMNYDALATAVAKAIKAAGLGATYLDGKMLKASLNKEAQRSGKPVLNY